MESLRASHVVCVCVVMCMGVCAGLCSQEPVARLLVAIDAVCALWLMERQRA